MAFVAKEEAMSYKNTRRKRYQLVKIRTNSQYTLIRAIYDDGNEQTVGVFGTDVDSVVINTNSLSKEYLTDELLSEIAKIISISFGINITDANMQLSSQAISMIRQNQRIESNGVGDDDIGTILADVVKQLIQRKRYGYVK